MSPSHVELTDITGMDFALKKNCVRATEQPANHLRRSDWWTDAGRTWLFLQISLRRRLNLWQRRKKRVEERGRCNNVKRRERAAKKKGRKGLGNFLRNRFDAGVILPNAEARSATFGMLGSEKCPNQVLWPDKRQATKLHSSDADGPVCLPHGHGFCRPNPAMRVTHWPAEAGATDRGGGQYLSSQTWICGKGTNVFNRS